MANGLSRCMMLQRRMNEIEGRLLVVWYAHFSPPLSETNSMVLQNMPYFV